MKRRYNVFLAACCVLAVACLQLAYGGGDSLGVWSQDLPNSTRIYTMDISSTNGNLIYCAGLDSGVYKSTNAGANWVAVNTGLTYNHVQAIAMSQSDNNIVYCGTDQLGSTNSGVYKTTDGGASWTPVNNGILESSRGIQAIVVHPTNPNVAWMSVFDGLVNSTTGLYRTTDGGANWVPSINGIGTVKNFLSIAVNPLNPNTVYCGTSFSVVAPSLASRVYKSYDGGANWINVSNGLPTDTTIGHPVRALSISTSDTNVVLAALFLASDTLGGAYVTTNGGTTWVRKHTGLQSINGALPRACLIKPGSTTDFYVGLDAGTANARGVWATTDAGTSWFDFNGGSMVNTYTIRALVYKTQGNPTLYAGAANATVAIAGRGVYEYSWTAPSTLPQFFNYNNVGTSNNSFPFSVVAGKEVQWLFLPDEFNQPTPCPPGQQITKLYFFMVGAGTATFTNLTIKLGQADISTLPAGVIYSGPMDTVYNQASVSLSSNATSWMDITLDHPFAYNPARGLIVDVSQCAATAIGMTVRQNTLTSPPFRRTYMNNGGSCNYVYAGQEGNVLNFGIDVTPAGTTYNVPEIIYLKFTGGPTTTPNFAVPGRGNASATVTGHTIVPGGQFDSTLLGGEGTGATNWVDNAWAPNLGNGSWTIGFWLSGLHLPATIGNPCYLFGDVNTSAFRCFWAGAGISAIDTAMLLRKTGQPDLRLVLPNPSLGQASYVHVVYDSATSTLRGYRNGVLGAAVTWTAPAITGAGPFKIAGYSTAASSLVSGAKMDEFRVYSRALDTAEIRQTWNHTLPYTVIVDVRQEPPSGTPSVFRIEQNYPNPFNPVTRIEYSLPQSAHVSLKVYNILGQEIATLVNGQQSTGFYQVMWEGRNNFGAQVSSGVYFYRFEAAGASGERFSTLKKMLFLK